jgi:hypothetical protein
MIQPMTFVCMIIYRTVHQKYQSSSSSNMNEIFATPQASRWIETEKYCIFILYYN